MPHYKDGTEAKIGDQVKGRTYNTPGEICGTIVSITPGQECCNCQVAFVRIYQAPSIPYDQALARIRNASGEPSFVGYAIDYGETKAFEKIG